ncbi:helix-turn-helix domain-containing protein [Chitinophaga arvensicola]|uniref:AraC-type DNA-binding protein n=1 Tax=Chitinophaga arvensicola TaxID=29529 RepID=A0A1I0S9P5_9BACT|nr:AraC family transcriptional regulator [Chitinophaga arvensicola]SEW52765.1 AraC-type DNA-binding protein [Chitinophaga arvensicola]
MVFYYLALGSIFLLSFVLLSNAAKVNTTANRWLGVFFGCAGGALLAWIAEQTGLDIRYPYLVPVTESVRFVMAPALYLSVQYFTALTPGPAWKTGQHFLPAILFLPLLMGGSAYLPSFAGIIVGTGLKLQMLLYLLLSCRLLWKHQRGLGIFAGNIREINLKWLQWLLAGIATMVLLWYNQVWQISSAILQVSGGMYCIALYMIAYAVLQQQEIFNYPQEDKKAIGEVLATAPVAPRLKLGELEALKEKLTGLMQQEQLYRDGDLTLPQLARKMDLSIHEASWLLNKGYHQNFYQYINHYRIEQAKVLLHTTDYDHLSILGIAFEAGFNSKTTFNTVFKKTTGMSPREYRQLQVRMDTDGH